MSLILASVAAVSPASILVSYKAQAAVTSASKATGTTPKVEVKVGGWNATLPYFG